MGVSTEEVTTDMVFNEAVSRLRSKGTLQELDTGELVLAMLASMVLVLPRAIEHPPTETRHPTDPAA